MVIAFGILNFNKREEGAVDGTENITSPKMD
jgi:hypothetical protein